MGLFNSFKEKILGENVDEELEDGMYPIEDEGEGENEGEASMDGMDVTAQNTSSRDSLGGAIELKVVKPERYGNVKQIADHLLANGVAFVTDTNVGDKTYFTPEEVRKMIYLEPEKYTDAPQEVWDGYFFSTEPDGYFEGAHMDFNVIVPYSKKADEGEWKKSKLEKVKEYILKQM